MKKKLVILSGAGISAESGIKTFRDSDGLWEGHNVMDVATPEGFRKNPELVLDFYNQRRRQLHEVKPNLGHQIIAELESDFEVHIITQNVDNLHEQAGSSNVLHLHGELFKVRSIGNENHIIDWQHDLILGDVDPDGYQLRPHIVWFGEAVPMMESACRVASKADIFLVIGSSLVVYPAASLLEYAPMECPKFIIDPNIPNVEHIHNMTPIQATAVNGMKTLLKKLVDKND